MIRIFIKKFFVFLIAGCSILLFLLNPFNAVAAINPQINYQGRLLNSVGDPVADAGYNIQFKIYTTSVGGSPIWTETWCYSPDNGATCDGTGVDSRVDTINGLFSVMLGGVNSLSGVDFNQTLYLGVNIGATTTSPSYDGEMTPRKVLGSVPSAFESDRLDGVDSGQFFRNDIVNATSSATTSLSIIQNGAGKIAEFFSSGYTSVMSILSNGNVGIGTTTPYAKLSIDGNIAITGGIYDNNATRGTDGMVLQTTGTGVEWVATSSLGISGGGGTPAGSDTQIQFNSSGSFGADSDFTYNSTTNALTVGSIDFTTIDDYAINASFSDSNYSLNPSSGLSFDNDADSTESILSQGSLLFKNSSGVTKTALSESYLNFSSTIGSTGYGIRDNGGTIEFKDSAGTWASLASLAGGGGGVASSTTKFVTSNQQSTSSTLADITELSGISLNANTDYMIQVYLKGVSNVSTEGQGFSVEFSGTIDSMNLEARHNDDNATGFDQTESFNTNASEMVNTTGWGSNVGTVSIEGVLRVGATGGTFDVEFKSETGGANSTTIYAGSSITITELNEGYGANWVQNGVDMYYSIGDVGIGTTSPSGKLSIGQSTNDAAGGLWISATDGDYRSIYMDTSQVLNFSGGSGNVATLNALGAWTNASDVAYKENIETLDYGLEEIMLLNPRRYNWKSNGASDIGFIAQELEQVIPEVVFGEEGSKTVSYGQLTSLAISGLQDIGLRIDLFDAPTSTPSLKLDADGKFIVNSGFTVQDEAQIGSLNVLEGAIFENGIQTVGTSTSNFGGAVIVEGSLTLDSNGVTSANGFSVNGSQFYVAPDGAIGIGTTTPARMLHVLREGEGSPVRFQDSNGYCEIDPTSTTWACTSDEKLKENIVSLNNASILEKMIELRPVEFEWKTDKTNGKRTGFIAQEVEIVFPEFVNTDKETGLKSVAYGAFVPYIISAIQELSNKIAELDKKITEIKESGYANVVGAFQKLVVGSPQNRTGITLYDETSGEPYCISIRNGNSVTREGECGKGVVSLDDEVIIQSQTQSQPQTETKPDTELEAEIETEALSENEVHAEPQTEVQVENQAEPESETQPQTQPEPEPEVNVDLNTSSGSSDINI